MRVRSKQALLGVSLAVGGIGALCLGFKRSALTLFAAGVRELERDWRSRHPEFHGSLAERWPEPDQPHRARGRHSADRGRRRGALAVPAV